MLSYKQNTMLSYKQMAAVLAKKLTDAEFARLVDLLDGDAEGNLLEEANAVNYKRHPETYGDRNDVSPKREK